MNYVLTVVFVHFVWTLNTKKCQNLIGEFLDKRFDDVHAVAIFGAASESNTNRRPPHPPTQSASCVPRKVAHLLCDFF